MAEQAESGVVIICDAQSSCHEVQGLVVGVGFHSPIGRLKEIAGCHFDVACRLVMVGEGRSQFIYALGEHVFDRLCGRFVQDSAS